MEQEAINEGRPRDWKFCGGKPPEFTPRNQEIYDFYLRASAPFTKDCGGMPLLMQMYDMGSKTEDEISYFYDALCEIHVSEMWILEMKRKPK